MPQIVTITERAIRPAQPNLLQQRGILVSNGNSTLPAGTIKWFATAEDAQQIVGQPSINPVCDVTLVNGGTGYKVADKVSAQLEENTSLPLEITSVDENGVITGIAPTATLTGSNPTSYNGTFPVIDSGGSGTGATVQVQNKDPVANELSAMLASWFANNTVTGVYIFEAGSSSDISKGLSTLLTNAPLTYYALVLPRGSASDKNLVSLAGNYSGDSARCYFFFTETSESYQPLITNGNGQKSIACAVEYTGADVLPNTTGANLTSEHAGAALAAQWIGNPPTVTNKLAPMNFRQLVGITAWPDAGNLTKMAQMKMDNVNFPGTATQAGVQMTINYWGRFMNGDPMSGWYGADYTAINTETQLANLLVEGQQPGTDPLDYSPMGISELFGKLKSALDNAVTVGCILGSYQAAFVPFGQYVIQNPTDYGTETYNGLSATITPIRGFSALNMNLEVDFTGQSAAQAGGGGATQANVTTNLRKAA